MNITYYITQYSHTICDHTSRVFTSPTHDSLQFQYRIVIEILKFLERIKMHYKFRLDVQSNRFDRYRYKWMNAMQREIIVSIYIGVHLPAIKGNLLRYYDVYTCIKFSAFFLFTLVLFLNWNLLRNKMRPTATYAFWLDLSKHKKFFHYYYAVARDWILIYSNKCMLSSAMPGSMYMSLFIVIGADGI